MSTSIATTKFRIIDSIIIGIGFIMILLLSKLQLFDPFYSAKANTTTLNQNTVYPSRGLFYDRNGKLLVINYPTYDIYAVLNNISPQMDTAKFCKLLNITPDKFLENLKKDWTSGKFSKSIPFVFAKNVDSRTFLQFQENMFQFPGFTAALRSIREYPIASGANFLGYTSEVTQRDIDRSDGEYKPGDYIGVAGVEKKYEESIKGEKGVHFVLKDNLGREVGPFENGKLDKNATAGADLALSIDIDLQKYGEKLLEHKVGSIVAIEPSTGEILCLVTSPTFDPNLLSINPDRGRAFAYLLRDSLKPLFDRSSAAKYPPGSIFKPVMALIALQEGILTENTAHACHGGYFYKSVKVGCHIHPAPYNVPTALQHSCNAYFIETFRDFIDKDGFNKPGGRMDLLVKYLQAFGLGKPLYSDVSGESPGFIPTSDFFTRRYKTDQWRSTYIMSLGIGQGEFQLTTLQMANLACIMANRGSYITPHLLRGTIDNSSKEIIPQSYERIKVPVDQKYFNPVIEGMELAVKSGTATLAFNDKLSICGKTGTSENPHGEDHSVFFAFAPKYNPKIAIAVYVENAGWGGAVAAPIASLMIEKYITDSIARPSLEKYIIEKNLVNPRPKIAKQPVDTSLQIPLE